MDNEKVVEDVLERGEELVSYGKVEESILEEVLKEVNEYDWIEVIVNFYDDEDDPYFNNWTDVEGMGYGWLWCNYEEEDWHRMMVEEVKKKIETVKGRQEGTLYVVAEKDGLKSYKFIYIDEGREDIIINITNHEDSLYI